MRNLVPKIALGIILIFGLVVGAGGLYIGINASKAHAQPAQTKENCEEYYTKAQKATSNITQGGMSFYPYRSEVKRALSDILEYTKCIETRTNR